MNRTPQIPVCVFLTRFEPGGTERQMTELIRRLDHDRYEIHVACFDLSGAWLPRVLERAASVTEFPIRGFARPQTWFQMLRFARWCRQRRIAVLQACDLYANIFALPAAALAGVPVRAGSRRELNPDKSRAQIWLQRLAYRCATRVVANSPAAAAMLGAEGVRRSKITVIPNGIDTGSFRPRILRDDVRTVITVANLRAEKNHEALIAAAETLAPAHPHLRFQIVGAGHRLAELQSLAVARGVAHVVEFLGHREDIPALLGAADLFVLPSRSEAFPNGAIEAMAAGLPVIASAVGGLLDLIDDGRTGMLVPVDDQDALAVAIRKVIDNPALGYRLGAAAREDVTARFSFDRMVNAFENLYEDGLHRPAVAAQTAGVRV